MDRSASTLEPSSPDNAPLLTIAIPTYNRSRHLARLLDSLRPQLLGESRVELLVVDNASPDGTVAVVERYRRGGLTLRSLRNEVNIGADANFLRCFEEAIGEYLWLIGDDDILLPGSVKTVLNLISEERDLDVIYLAGRDIVEGSEKHLQTRAYRVDRFDDALAFVLRTHVYLTFITGNVLNRRRAGSLPHRPFQELIGTNLLQLGWMYTLVRHLRRGAYILNPMLASGTDSRGGYGFFHVFGTNFKRVTEEWLVEPALVRAVLNATLQRFYPGYAVHLEKGGVLGDKDPEALLHGLFARNYRYYLFVYPVFRVPKQVGRAWVLFGRIVNRLDKALGFPMVR